ncbi:uncharacterized protein METZ01_LOCUS491321 [marine metagenome]|uniref:Uncharacterized protein n=1 Tax=marine metagenome TaxID=408172 RepID=A0A383D1N8_9ZZZZ
MGQDGIRDRIDRLRLANTNIRLRTTLIVGYPGETDKDFDRLKSFVEEIRFDRLGIFTYSEEDGTSGALLKDDVPRNVKDDRKNMLLEIQHDISLEKNESFIGQTLQVLVDQNGEDVSVGRTEFDSPEIDNIVHIKDNAETGTFVKVDIKRANEYELIGDLA